MKEFVEKLIEKLNEITEPIRPVGWSRKIEAVETKAVIQIIKELQEEYKANLSESLTSSNNGWIPCSERLPEETGCYFVTWRDRASCENYVEIVEYDANREEWLDCICQAGLLGYDIIAWKPLPKPYKN